MTETRSSMPDAKVPQSKDEFERMKRKLEQAGPKTTEEIADMVEEMANNRTMKNERNKTR